MKLKKMICCVGMAAAMFAGTAQAQVEGEAPKMTPDQVKEKMKELGDEQRSLSNKLRTDRAEAMKNNPELAQQVKDFDEQIKELTQKREALFTDASPDVSATMKRMEEIRNEQQKLGMELRDASKPVKPVRPEEKKAPVKPEKKK